MTRYDQLLSIVDELRPATIVEVGVARGERARAMVLQALRHRPNVHYTGYDVFETRDAVFHAAAFNLKAVSKRADCAAMLAGIAKLNPGFMFEFVVGDTRDTLHGKSIAVDLAFIDGDHRVDAIACDYQALMGSATVVLDDYYTADVAGMQPDIRAVGCNRLVDRLKGAAMLLPAHDPVRGGGMVQMVRVDNLAK